MLWLTILIVTLSVVTVVMAFTRRLPAALMAFVTFLIVHWTVHGTLTNSIMWFWGIAAAIVTINSFMSAQPPVPSLRYYVVGGALVGTAVGAVAASMAALIVAGAAGAALGWFAFTRTPGGQINASVSRKLMMWADIALPALVAFYIIAIALFQLTLVSSAL
ncbi:MAG: hypothetical protein K2M19_08145 [Muribaculaceae bacterium]|nr:hypothetical protein [Muribaculaceae bacterium]